MGAGALVLASSFANPPGGYPWAAGAEGQSPQHTVALANQVRAWDNYGKCRATSDHFAISVDV